MVIEQANRSMEKQYLAVKRNRLFINALVTNSDISMYGSIYMVFS